MDFFNTNIQEQTLHNNKFVKNQDLKTGDYVIIIKKENSIYNYYKGYVGEILNYNYMQENIKILLPNLQIISIPRDHFEKKYK